MSPILTIAMIAVLVVATWILRGRQEMKKTKEYEEVQLKVKRKASLGLTQLRELFQKPLSVYEDLGTEAHNALVSGNDRFLREIGTTRKEVSELIKNHDLRHQWKCLMRDVQEIYYSEDMFDYYLEQRRTFLEENSLTLLDFGIDHDDADELRLAFYSRFAKHLRGEALCHISHAWKEIREFPALEGDPGLFEALDELERCAEQKIQ